MNLFLTNVSDENVQIGSEHSYEEKSLADKRNWIHF